MRQIGSSLQELVLARMLAGLLLTITIRSLASLEPRYAVAQARDGWRVLDSQARALAVESRSAVGLVASRPLVSLFMSPRGFADLTCTSFVGSVVLAFRGGPDVARAVPRPLGHLEVVDAP